MTLYVPSAGDFRWKIANSTARPGQPYGTTITPSGSANTFTSYTQLFSGATVVADVYGIQLNFNGVEQTTVARDMIATIGVDTAGGTSYTDTISNLLISCATTILNGGGVNYYFPLFITAGSSIAVKVSQNATNVSTFGCYVKLFGRPSRPETVRVGRYVETIGATVASSSGTAVTPGQAADGSWTSLGTTSKSTWWHQFGIGINNSAMASLAYAADLAADSAGNDLISSDTLFATSSAERINLPLTLNMVRDVPGGTTLYGRAQCSGTPDSGFSMAAYCVGG